MGKRELGQYFTENNPFQNKGFLNWYVYVCGFESKVILEPFAGSNNLITMLTDMGLVHDFVSYDIEPKNDRVSYRDCLLDFPKGFDVCITNPPYLAQNSAHRRGLDYPDCNYDDLYKYALSLCLENCKSVGAIIPASFLNSGLFRDRLGYYILLNSKMFSDTDHPVCLALFVEKSKGVKVYDDNKYLGMLSDLESMLPKPKNKVVMRFNDRDGKLGLMALDNTIEASIRFCDGNEIDPDKITVSSRSITRIGIDCDIDIDKLNARLKLFREKTHDIFLTPFKGLRKDGKYRRRLDFALARLIIEDCL